MLFSSSRSGPTASRSFQVHGVLSAPPSLLGLGTWFHPKTRKEKPWASCLLAHLKDTRESKWACCKNWRLIFVSVPLQYTNPWKKTERKVGPVFGLIRIWIFGIFLNSCKTRIYKSRKVKLHCVTRQSVIRELYFCLVGPRQFGVSGWLHLPEGVVLKSSWLLWYIKGICLIQGPALEMQPGWKAGAMGEEVK